MTNAGWEKIVKEEVEKRLAKPDPNQDKLRWFRTYLAKSLNCSVAIINAVDWTICTSRSLNTVWKVWSHSGTDPSLQLLHSDHTLVTALQSCNWRIVTDWDGCLVCHHLQDRTQRLEIRQRPGLTWSLSFWKNNQGFRVNNRLDIIRMTGCPEGTYEQILPPPDQPDLIPLLCWMSSELDLCKPNVYSF